MPSADPLKNVVVQVGVDDAAQGRVRQVLEKGSLSVDNAYESIYALNQSVYIATRKREVFIPFDGIRQSQMDIEREKQWMKVTEWRR